MTQIDVTSQFVHKELTKPLKGRPPTRSNIDVLLQEIYVNASAIPSSIDGNNHGCLYVVMTVAQYEAMMGSTYTTPTHPGIAPDYPTGATNAQIAGINRQYKA